MKEEIRRAIVSSVASRINGKAPANIYSYDRGRHSAMGERYDYEAGAYFSDSFHYGTGSHLDLKISGKKFEGFDYGAGHHLSGSVNGSSVEIFDYGEGRSYNYSV
jgi:hypothetical protein